MPGLECVIFFNNLRNLELVDLKLAPQEEKPETAVICRIKHIHQPEPVALAGE